MHVYKLFFNLIWFLFKIFDEKCQNMIFLKKKKSHFWHFLSILYKKSISEKGKEKENKKQKKKQNKTKTLFHSFKAYSLMLNRLASQNF